MNRPYVTNCFPCEGTAIENRMVIGAASAYERTLPIADARSIQWATEELLADVEAFTDQLSAACLGRNNLSSAWFLRRPERMAEAEADDATVLQALLVSEERGDAAEVMRCAGLLKRRYLERNDARLCDAAGRIAREFALDASNF